MEEICYHSSVFLITPTPIHDNSLQVNLKISIFKFADPIIESVSTQHILKCYIDVHMNVCCMVKYLPIQCPGMVKSLVTPLFHFTSCRMFWGIVHPALCTVNSSLHCWPHNNSKKEEICINNFQLYNAKMVLRYCQALQTDDCNFPVVILYNCYCFTLLTIVLMFSAP